MKIIIVILFCCIGYRAIGQEEKKESKSVKLSELIEAHAYWWRLDSLANNGYRLCSSDGFLKKNIVIDSVSRDFLVAQFGKPSRIWNTPGTDIIYRYFIYDYKTLSEEQKTKMFFYAAVTLDFTLNEKTLLVEKLDQGSVDY